MTIAYIRRLAEEYETFCAKYPNVPPTMTLPNDVVREYGERRRSFIAAIQELTPREFPPEAGAAWARLLDRVKHDINHSLSGAHAGLEYAREAIHLLALHSGDAPIRAFPWLVDPKLRVIVERDYDEVKRVLEPAGSTKGTVVMAGSIVEAILFAVIVRDPARAAAAKASTAAPRQPDETKWLLHELIKIAPAIGLISKTTANTLDALRDYRNFIHPSQELRSGHPCGKAQVASAMGALDGLCDHFDRNPP